MCWQKKISSAILLRIKNSSAVFFRKPLQSKLPYLKSAIENRIALIFVAPEAFGHKKTIAYAISVERGALNDSKSGP